MSRNSLMVEFVEAVPLETRNFCLFMPITERKLYNGQFSRKESRAHAGYRSSISHSGTNLQRPKWHEIAHNDALLAKNEARRGQDHSAPRHFCCGYHTSDMLSASSFHWSGAWSGAMRAPKNGIALASSEKWCRNYAARAEPIKKDTVQFTDAHDALLKRS